MRCAPVTSIPAAKPFPDGEARKTAYTSWEERMASASERRTVVRAACPHDCPDTCAMLVTVDDGRVVAVRGDPQHPFTRGGLCVKVNNYEQRVYSPDRVLHPLKRSGPKGTGQ